MRGVRRFPLTETVDQRLRGCRVRFSQQHGLHAGQRAAEIGRVLLFRLLEITPRVLAPVESKHREHDVGVNQLRQGRGLAPSRLMGRTEVPRTGFVVAANLQHVTGKPWARAELVRLRQGDTRILLEPRGSRRLSSQTLLDLRLSRTIRWGDTARIELLLDVLNALNDTAEEGLVTDYASRRNFAQPTLFIDPRRAMVGVRVDLGR
jgi:hypothetical protein